MNRTATVVLTLITEHDPAELARRLAQGRGVRTKGGDGGEWLGCGAIRSAVEHVAGLTESREPCLTPAPAIAVAPAPPAETFDDQGSLGAPRPARRASPATRRAPKPQRKANRRTRR